MDGFDEFGSDSDDDDSEANRKAELRAEILIAKVASAEGCSYPAAMRHILANPGCMDKAGVTKRKMKHFSLDTHRGRDKFKRKLFEKTINGIGYQQELRHVLELYFGSQLNLTKIIKNWSSYDWPFEITLLYIYQIGDFELTKIKDHAKSKNLNFDEQKLKFFIKERQLMKHVFIDNLFLNKNKDLRGYVLNTLEFVLNRERNVRNKLFSLSYDKDRGTLVSDTNKVKDNYIFNYNNKVRQLKGRASRPLVSIGVSNGSGNNNYNNSGSGDKKEICQFFNSTKGCQFGRRCNKDNVCIECKNDKHGVTSCYRVARKMMDNGTIQRIMERRPGISRHDPSNGVIIGIDGRNYYINNNHQHNDFGNNQNWNFNNNNNNKTGRHP